MGRSGMEKVLDCFCIAFSSRSSCICMKTLEEEEEEEAAERKSLIRSHVEQVLKIKDALGGSSTLAFHLEPKTVVLKVSMHCIGCARKVQKHIAKMEGMKYSPAARYTDSSYHGTARASGVTSFQVDLESKKVVVVGDITPFEVLESVSRVKFAELWLPPQPS